MALDFPALDDRKSILLDKMNGLPPISLHNYDRHFDIIYTHESTAMEGNTLSLVETKLLLDDKISVGGKRLREIYEVVNHDKAFSYVRQLAEERRPLDETILKNIHGILMENIFPGGIYRNHNVRIVGANHTPPAPAEMYQQMQFFFADMPGKKQFHPIEFAAWTHAEFVRVHPFPDGNGRTARMIMNYQLMQAAFLPISIKLDNRERYYKALDTYAATGLLDDFAALVYDHERAALDEMIDFLG